MDKKNILTFCLVLSVVGNALLLYRVADLGVTTTHQSEQIRLNAQQAKDAEEILPMLINKTSRDDVLFAARKAGLTTFEKEEGLIVGQLLFVFSGELLDRVIFSYTEIK
tara:strand:+ start:70653 stop:70979 length:327 start_codon:yes stop_codon:yes gene_type:complete